MSGFSLADKNYFLGASTAAGAAAGASAGLAASAAGAAAAGAASAAGAAGLASSFLPQAETARANKAANRSDFFIIFPSI
jgi:hypothetical protein